MTATTAPSPDLIRRAQDGDEAAFTTLYEAYRGVIHNHIYRMIWDWERAEELAADTWAKVWLALPTTRRDSPLQFAAFVYRVATNAAIDAQRHEQKIKWQPWEAFISVFHPSHVADDNPERDCLAAELEVEVRGILDQLPLPFRQVMRLREYHDLSYNEIAALLFTTRAAVKSTLFRARSEFRYRWQARERARRGLAA